MDKYYIETRLRKSPIKDYIEDLFLTLSKKGLQNYSNRIVPYFTIIRPFTADNENNLIKTFEETLSGFNELLTYKINGFGVFEKPERVFYVNIEKNEKINGITKSLEENLEGKINYFSEKVSSPKDKDDINLHITIAKGFDNKYFEEINSFLEEQRFNPVENPLFRICLMKNKRPFCEYDFALKRNLDFYDCRMNSVFKKTKEIFSEKSGLILSEYGIVIGKKF